MTHLTTYFALGLTLTLGCAANVERSSTSGGDGGGGDGAGGDGAGGSVVCATYLGDGCTPGDFNYCSGHSTTPSLGDSATGPSLICVAQSDAPCTTKWVVSPIDMCLTPLVLSFDSTPVDYLTDRDHGFDLAGMESVSTDWPTSRTPWLALDRDGNGRIDDGGELFGSMSLLAGGGRASNGFVALRELDADGDGRITPRDPGFARLLVWSDRDGDRRSTPGELAPAAAWELLSIDLDYTVDRRCTLGGNCEVERASFRYRDTDGRERTGAVIDVHLAAQR